MINAGFWDLYGWDPGVCLSGTGKREDHCPRLRDGRRLDQKRHKHFRAPVCTQPWHSGAKDRPLLSRSHKALSAELSTEHRPAGVSVLADLTRHCASGEEGLMLARGILGASLEEVVLHWGFERL